MKQQPRKISAERVTLEVRSRFNPIAGITPERLVRRMDAWDTGYFYEFGQTLATIIRRDDKVKPCVAKRMNSLARYGWEVTQNDDVQQEDAAAVELASQQVEALTFFFRNLTARDVLKQKQTGGMRLLCQQMGSALAFDHSVHEIVWQPRGKFYTAELWHCPVWFFENTTGDLRFSPTPGAPGEEMADMDWLVGACDGIGQATAIAWMFKRLPLRDWLTACKKFGIPFLHGTSDAQPGSREWQEFVTALGAFANDGAVVTSPGSSIVPVEVKNMANMPMKDLVEWADRALTSLWRGSDLGTMSQKGDSVGASNQQSETDTLEHDDTLWISETLQTQLARKVLALTFGPDAPVYAEIRVKTLQKQNVEMELKTYEAAVKFGVPVTKHSFAENFRVPMEDGAAEEDLLAAPAPPAPPQPQGVPVKGAKNAKVKVDKVPLNELLDFNTADGLVDTMLADGRIAKWLAPAAEWFDKLEALAANAELSDADVLAHAANMANAMPELLGNLNIEELAAVMREGMGTATITGAKSALKGKA